MKKSFLILGLLFCALASNAQVKVSILGDSYSTFEGWVPEGNHIWYAPTRGNDVKQVGQTWWHQLIEDNGLELELNNSFSGATICNTGYQGDDYTDRSFLSRSTSLGENPDLIFVFGGTNDDWAHSPLGEADGNDMYAVRPAAKAMFKNIKTTYPDALCVAIINTEMTPEVEAAIIEVCDAEQIPYVKLESIDKQKGHPSISGMKAISKQVWKATAPMLYSKLSAKADK